MANPNVLSRRYATKELNDIFSEEGTVRAERELWIAVMKAQSELGLDIPSEDILKFERAKDDIDLERIREIATRTRHDVKAKIEAFVEVAGAGQHVHKGMTSRDLTDNVEMIQMKKAAGLVFGKYVSVLRHMMGKAGKYKGIVIPARTHHQPAQPTVLGRRFAMWGEELLEHAQALEDFIESYRLRGIKGPVATQFDMRTLLGGEQEAAELEQSVAQKLGFARTWDAPGQVYPRSVDQSLIGLLSRLAAPVQSFATTMRLMAGDEYVTEGFKEGQVGSSAMPHKMNTRSSERIVGFSKLLKGYANMAAMNAGDQWEEGDVSCSVVRRVIVPDSFYASDGLCETALTVLNEMGVYEKVVDRDCDRYLPFLATTQMLMIAVRAGIGREVAHGVIKKHAQSAALELRHGAEGNTLVRALSEDEVFRDAGVTYEQLESLLADKYQFIGSAEDQIAAVCERADDLIEGYPEYAEYEPGDIL